MAYVAPKRIVNESNGGNENKAANTNGTTNGVNGTTKTAKKFPKWGGAEVCPRCDKSVINKIYLNARYLNQNVTIRQLTILMQQL